jgi:hypothetical protein
VHGSADRLVPALREEFRGDGLEVGEGERLFQQSRVSTQRFDPGGNPLVTKPGDDNDRRVEPGGSRCVHREQPRHPWHRNVRDDEVEWTVLGQMVDELGAVAGPNDIGSQTREAFGYDGEEFGIVVRDEDTRVELHSDALSNQHAERHTREDRCAPRYFVTTSRYLQSGSAVSTE